MKIKRINTVFLLLALAGMTLAGCSNEDIANVTPQEKGTGNVTFSIVEKDYEPATDNPKTRAAAEETKSVTQDLGDGLMAEVSLVPDTTHRATAPKTRAINTPTHYTIQAFQGGVKKGELKGTFNGSTFTPDTGQPEAIDLPHGSYDFVCFNDDVTSNGTQLTVNRSAAATARFTVKRGVVINQDPKQQVEFTLKHAGAMVSYELSSCEFFFNGIVTSTQTIDDIWGQPAYVCDFANEEDRIKYKIESAASTVPSTMVYDFATGTYSYPTTEQVSKSANAALGTVLINPYTSPGGGFGTSFIRVPADYYLPSTNCADMKLTFTHGKILGGNLAGKSITIPTSKLVDANKTYMVVVRFYLADRYVYSDGSYGPRSQNSTKTPIAVIVAEQIAIALHDVNEGGAEQLQWGNNTTSSEVGSRTCKNYSDLFDVNQYGKVDNTTGAVGSAVSGYTPVAPSGHVWQVPSLVNFLSMGITLGRMTENSFEDSFSFLHSGKQYAFFAPSGAAATGFTPAPSAANFPAMDMARFNRAFTNVGGTPPSGTYWTGMECKVGSEYKMATIEISGGKLHLGLKSKTETAKVRPFIFY